jgi:hypothetical protein
MNILCFHFVAVDEFRKTATGVLEAVLFFELDTVTNSVLSATVCTVHCHCMLGSIQFHGSHP